MAGTSGSPALSFRDATLGDVAALRALIESAYRGEESRLGWTTEADLLAGARTSEEELAAVIGATRSLMLIAEDAALGPVGCCRLEGRGPEVAYLGMLAVRPRLQDRGIGRALATRAEQRARQDWGARTMTLSVISRRTELIAWYERLGYRPTGEILAFDDPTTATVDRPDLTFLVMEKELSA